MFYNLINSEALFVFVLIVGLTSIIMEIFIPSFGLVGLMGAYLSLNALLAIENINNPYILIVISIIASIILGIIILKLFLRHGRANKFVLNTTIGGNSKPNKDVFDGACAELEGQEAVVRKSLRPTGTITIASQDYDALTYGEFIGVGERVFVEKVEGNRIYCRRKS